MPANKRPKRAIGIPNHRPDVTEVHPPTQLDRIESLLLQLLSCNERLLAAMVQSDEGDDERPTHDLDGNPLPDASKSDTL